MTADPFVLGWSAGWLPDLKLWLDEWSDRHIYLSQESSAEPGRWRTDRTPYLRGIMRELSPASSAERIVFMKGAQVGGTQIGLNWIGYVIEHAPGPIIAIEPTVDLAKRFSKQRLDPMIENCPALSERIPRAKSRDSSNTQLAKEFPGGILILTGANSAAGLRSMPARYLFADEIDAYPIDVEDEGDPVSLAEKRTTTFRRRKVFMVSTPTEAETSRIAAEFKRSDQRRFYVPCPHCGEFQWLRWRDDAGTYRLVFEPGRPETAAYMCEHCGALIEERHKTEMLAAGEWRPTAIGDGRTVGFHVSSLYSPLGWKSWGEIVADFLDAKASPEKLKTWVNTTLGEAWESNYAKRLDKDSLAGRAEMYQEGTAPRGAFVPVAGVDVQDDRLAVVIRAFGRNEESWLIRHCEIFGDTLGDAVWQELDDLLLAPIPYEGGGVLRVRAALVDSGDGDRTHTVYNWTRPRARRLVFPCKGLSVPGRPVLGKPTLQDINYKGKVVKDGARLYPLGVDTIKAIVYGRISNASPAENRAQYHWHDGTSDQYFGEVTAERQAIKFRHGRAVRFWTKKDSDRNEAFDAEVYAYAALQVFYRHHNPATVLDKIEAGLQTAANPAPLDPGDSRQDRTTETRPTEPAQMQQKKRPFVRPRGRGNFATGF